MPARRRSTNQLVSFVQRSVAHAVNDLDAVLERDPAASSRVEVALLYPGVHALWAHRVSNRLWNRNARITARAVSQVARLLTGVEIHPAATIGPGTFIDHGMAVVIGETAEIGPDVTIHQGVTLGGAGLTRGKRHPTIGDRVTIGPGASVLGNLVVGHDSRISANSVVLHSVESHSIVVGAPGRAIADSSLGRAGAPVSYAPDPVGAALQELQERVTRLEDQAT